MNKLLTFVVGILLLTTSLAMAAGSESTPPRDLETWRAASKEIYALLADGTVLNMQKKFVEATPLLRQALDKALESGIPSQIDRIRLELARALVETDQGAEAATLAETVYRRTPDSSMAALRYGQALLSVGRTHDAIGILKQAYQDEFLADEAANLLGQAHEALGNRSEAARMHIVASMRPYAGVQVQEDSKAALKRMNVTMEEIRVWDKEWRQAARPLAKQPQKKDPFTASIQVGVEAGDNIPAIADELAPFVPRRADTGKFWNVDLGYNFRDDKHQRIDLDVGYSGNDYHHLNQFETDSINALLAWRVHGKNHQWRFVPSIGRMELGDRDYLHNWGMEVGYVHRQATGRWLDANVRGRWNDYQIAPRLSREDRDGRDTRLSISQNWRETTRSGLSSTYGIGLFAARADTDGADYDTDKRGLRLFLRRDLNRKLTFYGSYTYEDRDHDNASVRSVTGQSRHDKDHQTFMRLDHRFDKKQSVFATYQDSLNDSNLGTSFGFRARTWSLGYSHDF